MRLGSRIVPRTPSSLGEKLAARAEPGSGSPASVFGAARALSDCRPIDLVVMVVPPVPICLVIGIVARFPLSVVAVRFMLPPDVIRGLARSPRVYHYLPMLGTTGSQERKRQNCSNQESINFLHSMSFRFCRFSDINSQDAAGR